MRNNRLTSYFAYALGEIILVVIGILIAIRIDDWNKERVKDIEELQSYKLIITDLKKDSVAFQKYHEHFSKFLETYYNLYEIKENGGNFNGMTPDYIVSNIQFNPVTQNNHQSTIEKLRNNSIREEINKYFGRLEQVRQATEEFNTSIEEVMRPYFLVEQGLFEDSVVFYKEDRTFPPLRGVSVIDTIKLRKSMNEPKFVTLLAQLRMGIGYYLTFLEFSMEQNHQIIKDLEDKLE